MTRRLMAALLVLGLGPAAAAAQTTTTTTSQRTVQDIVTFLVTNQGVQTNDFDKDTAAAQATSDTLARALLSSIATVPMTSSSSGFSYRFNPTLGTVERASETFGPFYVERALTAGAGQASFGFNVRFAAFESLDGNNLRNGEFVTVANQFADEPEPFDVETLTLKINTSTATIVGNIGVTDRIDVGVGVPLIRLDISGSRLNDYRGTTLLQARATAQTTGFGDIAVRSKIRLTGEGPGAAAAAVEARLPTGREEDLLGAGDPALRFLGLGSYEAGRVSYYGNVGVGTGGIGHEFSASGAVAVATTPHVTIVGEVLTRRIAGLQRIAEVSAPHPRINGVNTIRLMPAGEDESTSFVVGGFKWNLGGTWLLQGHVLMPLSENGLTATFTPTIALDYSFAR